MLDTDRCSATAEWMCPESLSAPAHDQRTHDAIAEISESGRRMPELDHPVDGESVSGHPAPWKGIPTRFREEAEPPRRGGSNG